MVGCSVISMVISSVSGILLFPAECTFANLMPDPKPEKKGRILSGMRPTGKLHLGNYVGALRNWVQLQDEYDCFFFIADWHALTTDYADTRNIKQNSLEVMIDYLAAGLDPERSTLFIQSHVPAACRTATAVQHDYAAGVAGTRSNLQRAAREHQRQGPEHLRLSGLSLCCSRLTS